MKIRLTSLFLSVLLLGPAGSFAFTVKSFSHQNIAQWPEGDEAIFYVVSSRSYGTRPESLAALARAFKSWERMSRGNVAFIFSGRGEEARARKDGTNTLVWIEEEWNYGDEIVAMSTVWLDPQSGLIREADIEFNARDYVWSEDGSGEMLDIQTVAMHEIGHLLGIEHSFNPGAVMHEAFDKTRPLKRALSRDDIEALLFLYPSRKYNFVSYDLPVLLYPEDFPGEATPRISPGPRGGAFRWITAVSSVDADGDGSPSELIGACVDGAGNYFLEARRFAPGQTGDLLQVGERRRLAKELDVAGITGIDLDGDGVMGEVAVLSRDESGETLFCYDAVPDPGAAYRHLASCAIVSPPANNVVGMTALDADGDGVKNELAILRASRGGFSLHFHPAPALWETVRKPQRGQEVRLPGFLEGSRLLGVASVDSAAAGEGEDLTVLEKTSSGEFWLHFYRTVSTPGGSAFDISYLTSVAVPEAEGSVLPLRMTGIDVDRDGFFSELLILSGR